MRQYGLDLVLIDMLEVSKMDQLNMCAANLLNLRLMMPYLPLPGLLSPADMQQLWKEASEQITEEQLKGLNGVTSGLPAASPLHPALLGLNGLAPEGFPFSGRIM